MNVKHKLVVAAVATAALAAGGSAVAFAGDDAVPADALAASLRTDAGDGTDDETGERDERDGDRRELRGAKVTLQEAVGAALKAVPGTAESAELDDEDGRTAWDVDVLGEDGRWHEVRIDAAGGGVLGGGADRDDRDDDGGDGAGGRDDDRQGARSDDSDGSEDRDEPGDDRGDRTAGDRDDRSDDGSGGRDGSGDDRGDD
jgi:uncharacterized membrane protein YkoI